MNMLEWLKSQKGLYQKDGRSFIKTFTIYRYTTKLEFEYRENINQCYVYLHQQREEGAPFYTILLGAALTKDHIKNFYEAITGDELIN